MKHKIFYILILFLTVIPVNLANAETMAGKLAGRILLQVEQNGEAWYINPVDKERYFLGRPEDAFFIMRNLGIGITNSNLLKIPIAIENLSGKDSDSDGLPDAFEDAIGTNSQKTDSDNDGCPDRNELINNYNPSGYGSMPVDLNFVNKNLGKIFLQVENHGEAWYVNPKDKKRYFLGRIQDAFNLMRSLGLGIANSNLKKINISKNSILPVVVMEDKSFVDECSETNRISSDSRYNLTEMEKEIYNLINQERKKNGLGELEWNCEVAKIARSHSLSLAQENVSLTSLYKTCDYPIIHHENLSLGLYHKDRLNNAGIYYFNRAGENIALMPGVTARIFSGLEGELFNLVNSCEEKRSNFNNIFIEKIESSLEEERLSIVEEELSEREEEFKKEKDIMPNKFEWQTKKELENETIQGWMNSPGHRKNILTAEYDETGVGVAYVNGYIIATQIFITRTDCGYKGGSCCIKEGYYPSCFVGLECRSDICR